MWQAECPGFAVAPLENRAGISASHRMRVVGQALAQEGKQFTAALSLWSMLRGPHARIENYVLHGAKAFGHGLREVEPARGRRAWCSDLLRISCNRLG